MSIISPVKTYCNTFIYFVDYLNLRVGEENGVVGKFFFKQQILTWKL